jgi:Putative Ig domain
LPPGLSLGAATGVISGTPTTGGSYSATVQVTDSGSPAKTASAVVPFVIVTPLSVATSSLSAATVNVAYSTTLAAVNGTGPYKWSLAVGTLPAGMTLSSAGVISGTTTSTGSFPFTVAVQDSASPVNSANASFTLVVNATGPVTVTTTTVPSGTVGSVYSTTLLASGGTGTSYSWSVVSGALPPGVLLDGVAQGNTAGQLLGVPTSAGTYNFTVQATGSASAAASLSITIAPMAGTNNSALNGHYAFYLSGFTDPDSCTPVANPVADQPMMMVGSFVADGAGNILSGLYDSYVCGTSTTLHAFSGTYSVGADGRGRMVMTNVANGQSTFAFSVAQVAGGVAQQAQFIEFDDVSEDFIGSRGSGVMQMQDTTAFATAKLNGSYVYGLTGPGPAAGLWTFNGAGVIGGPSATGTYGSPDTVSGRTVVTVNGTSYVMYIVNQQQAFLSTTGNALAAAGISVGQTRLQQSSSFNNASINGSLVAYGLRPPPSGSFAGGGLLGILSGDGAGNLTGTQDLGSQYGPTPFTTTYSVSSNGLVVLGTGDVIWLYATNAGFSVPASVGNALLTYENAAGGPYTFDTSTGYSVGSVPPRNGEINLLNGSAIATDYSSEDIAGSQPLGLSTTSTGQSCTGCAHSAVLSSGRLIELVPNLQYSSVILIYQK